MGVKRVVVDLLTEIVVEENAGKAERSWQGMSQTGKCIRQLWLKKNGYGVAPLPASITTWDDGHLHEADVIRLLKQKYTVFDSQVDAAGNPELDSQGWTEQWELTSELPVFSGKCHVLGCDCLDFTQQSGEKCAVCDHAHPDHSQFRGHIDGIIEMPVNGDLGWYILEVKSRNVPAFQRVVKDGPRKTHWSAYLQIQAYLHHAYQLPFPINGCYYVAKAKEDPKTFDTAFHGEIIYYEPLVADAAMAFEIEKRKSMKDDGMVPRPLELNEDGLVKSIPRRYAPLCSSRYCQVRDACFSLGEGAAPVGELHG